MKSKTAVVSARETNEKDIAAPEPIAKAKSADTVSFDVRPSETVSIVAGNRILHLGKGLTEIKITR